MRVIQFNATCGVGSTGKIAVEISKILSVGGIDNLIVYSSENNGYNRSRKISNGWYIKGQAIKSKILGNYGFNSIFATRKLINIIEEFHPDIVHLHNIHGHDCNIEILFKYLKDKNIKIIWTFHDCWAFTAYCPHFLLARCEKWKSMCKQCPQLKKYSVFFDKSNTLFKKKKELFSRLNLTIVTPSIWLSKMVSNSFLSKYDVRVINNGIDLNIFKPQKSNCSIKKDKFIILGVAFNWSYAKGLDVFIELF